MAPTIRRVTATPVRVPIERTTLNCPEFAGETLNRAADGGWGGPWFADVPFYVIKVEGGDGTTGFGCTVRGRDETEIVRLIRRLIGQTSDDITPQRDLADHAYHRGLHTAALDWRARCEAKPLWSLFGSKVRDRVELAHWSAFRTPAVAARIAKSAQDVGVNCLKLKANLQTDVGGISAAVADACGGDFKLVIDPNGRFETIEGSVERARAVPAHCRQVYFEDPVYGRESVPAMAAVRRQTHVHCIKTVRSFGLAEEAEANGVRMIDEAVAANAVDTLNLAGIWPELLALSAAAQRHGLPYWVGSSCESGINDLAIAHFAATQPAFTAPCEMAGHMSREHHLLRASIPVESGHVIVPDAPGLGIDVDEAAVERYRIADALVAEG